MKKFIKKMTRVFGAASAAVVLASTLAHTQVNPFPAPKLVKTSKVRADGSLVPNSNSEKPSYPKLYDTPATAPSAQKVVAPNATPSNGKMIIQEMTCRFMIDGSGEVTCEFRFNPATDSDLKPAGVPI
jgi:hypothetical protein